MIRILSQININIMSLKSIKYRVKMKTNILKINNLNNLKFKVTKNKAFKINIIINRNMQMNMKKVKVK